MANIEVLDQSTIDKIAAGEVIERPSSVVKELVENAIDAGATAIAVEIKDGGISFIRITDNGSGIRKEEVPLAFLRHATSKIKTVEDLFHVASLGFRGEALSSIAAVAQVELITKTSSDFIGVRYLIDGGREKGLEEIGAPEGTTFLVRNLFYNTPARKKFLKNPAVEASYINDLVERLALSHPDISFKFIHNNKIKLHTSGNTNLKDIIYHVYGREISSNLIETAAELPDASLHGFIGKPVISRGNRNYENYYINGRYIKSSLISRAIEDAYKTFMMQHKYPFTVLHFTIAGELLDINVHPTKMELRFSDHERIYQFVYDTLKNALNRHELIPEAALEKQPFQKPKFDKPIPEPFEKQRIEQEKSVIRENYNYEGIVSEEKKQSPVVPAKEQLVKTIMTSPPKQDSIEAAEKPDTQKTEQLDLFERKLLDQSSKSEHKIIGQLFETYWLVQFEDKLFIIDQHAAHEKVLYERMMKELENKEFTSQMVSPPLILTLNMQEENTLKKYQKHFKELGFEVEHFGGKEYSICAVPANLFGLAGQEVFIELLDGLEAHMGNIKPEIINEKIASMSCKAAVKGNHKLSQQEMKALIEELLKLENPYNCPHGRPTIISMTKYELEKKFKRIV